MKLDKFLSDVVHILRSHTCVDAMDVDAIECSWCKALLKIEEQKGEIMDEVAQLKAERTTAWKQRNEMKDKVIELEKYIEQHVKLCSECEEPVKVEEDTCVGCAWKLKHQ